MRTSRLGVVLVCGLLACQDAAAPLGMTGGVVLKVLPSAPGGASHLDSGYVRVDGPTDTAVKATPGQPVTINNLAPGTYTIELEGFDSGGLAYFGQASSVVVRAGQTTTATPSFDPLSLAFKVQPGDVRFGRAIAPAVQVSIVNPAGTTITRATNSVTVALGSNLSGTSLSSGTETVAAVNGVATFSNLTVNDIGNGYTLVASSGSLTGATSSAFAVTARTFVANAGGSVDVIETATNTVLTSFAIGGTPRYVALKPDGTRAYVTNQTTNSVFVFNTSTNTLVTTIGVGASPMGIAVTSDGSTAYVANSGAATVSVIRTSDNTVTKVIPVGSGSFGFAGLAVTPNGAKVYVTNQNGNSVSVINRTAGDTVSVVPVGAGPFNVGIRPDGAFAYVTNNGGNSVSVIQVSNNSVLTTIPVAAGPEGVGFAPDGTAAYVSHCAANTIALISMTTNQVVTYIPSTGSCSVVVAVSPGGRFVYVTNEFSNNVTVISAQTRAAVATFSVGPNPFGIAIGAP